MEFGAVPKGEKRIRAGVFAFPPGKSRLACVKWGTDPPGHTPEASLTAEPDLPLEGGAQLLRQARLLVGLPPRR